MKSDFQLHFCFDPFPFPFIIVYSLGRFLYSFDFCHVVTLHVIVDDLFLRLCNYTVHIETYFGHELIMYVCLGDLFLMLCNHICHTKASSDDPNFIISEHLEYF